MFFFKLRTAYDVRFSDWSADVCSSDLKYMLRALRLDDCTLERTSLLVDGYRKRIGLEPENLAEILDRSEERSVGKKCVRTSRSRRSPDHSQHKTNFTHHTHFSITRQHT